MSDLSFLNYLILNIKQSHDQIENFTKTLTKDLVKFHSYLIENTIKQNYKENIEILLKVHNKIGNPSFDVKWIKPEEINYDFADIEPLYEPDFTSTGPYSDSINDYNKLHDIIIKITSKVFNISETIIRGNDDYSVNIDTGTIDFYFELSEMIKISNEKKAEQQSQIAKKQLEERIDNMDYEAALNDIQLKYRTNIKTEKFEISEILEASCV